MQISIEKTVGVKCPYCSAKETTLDYIVPFLEKEKVIFNHHCYICLCNFSTTYINQDRVIESE